MNNRLRLFVVPLFVCLAAASTVRADGPPEARLLRYPDAWGDFVVFTYAGDLWRAPIVGGPALRLTSHIGQEVFPKISPDGKWIAFSGEYSGTRPVEGQYLWLSSLVEGTKRYPELRSLLPGRPAGAQDCPCLAYPLFAEGKVACPECCGLGWLEIKQG